jgi:RNA-binding protein YhbY
MHKLGLNCFYIQREHMTRSILSTAQIHPAIHPKIDGLHQDVVEEVKSAIQAHRLVGVKMSRH